MQESAPETFFKVLSDPTRLRILHLLGQHGELCVCDLQSVLALSQPKISRHLKVLRDEGVVTHRRDGLWIHYRVAQDLANWKQQTLSALAEGIASNEPYLSDSKRLTDSDPAAACKTCG